MSNITFKQKIMLVLFGFILLFFLLEIGLRIAGVVYLSLQEHRNRVPSGKENVYHIMCLGESTTALGGDDSYPSQLEKILNQRIPDVKFKVINKGLPGVGTDVIISLLRGYINIYKPDMVITMMGINDDENPYPKGNKYFFKIKKYIKDLRTYKLGKLLLLRFKEFYVLRDLYLQHGWHYLEIERYSEAGEMFKKAMQLFPYDAMAYVGLGCFYDKQGMNFLAKEMFKKAEDLAAKDASVYIKLGSAYCDLAQPYQDLQRIRVAEEMFKKAIKLDPKNYQPYCDLAQLYQNLLRLREAEEMFKKAIEAAPGVMEPYLQLGWFYYEHSRPIEAEEMFVKVSENEKDNLIIYRELGYVKQSQGKDKEAESYFKMARPLAEYLKRITCRNYRILKGIVLKKGIKLVCVQYPMRPFEDLKEYFDSKDAVIFVDNEKAFSEALKKGKYEDFFEDRFGGNFGHCTPEGNRLLANNIAETIIREDLFHNDNASRR